MTQLPTPEDKTEQKPTSDFLRGIAEFNSREFFACHETLEDVWREQTAAEREFTQGVIQAAVAYYHLERSNRLGAIKLFHRALPRLQKFAPVCFTVDVPPLAEAVAKTLAALEGDAISEAVPGPPTIKFTT